MLCNSCLKEKKTNFRKFDVRGVKAYTIYDYDDYIQSNSIKEMNSVELQEEIKKCLHKAIELTKSYHVKIIKKKHKYLQMKVEYVCYANRFLKLNWKYQKLVQNVQVHDLVCNMMRPLLRKEEYLNNIME